MGRTTSPDAARQIEKDAGIPQKLQTERANKVAENREKLARKGIAPRGRGPNNARRSRSPSPSPKEVKEPVKRSSDQVKRLLADLAVKKEEIKRTRAGERAKLRLKELSGAKTSTNYSS